MPPFLLFFHKGIIARRRTLPEFRENLRKCVEKSAEFHEIGKAHFAKTLTRPGVF